MENKILVFGGWASRPEILDLFSDPVTYIDINPYMPDLITNGKLESNWIDTFLSKSGLRVHNVEIAVGWSTGGFFAYEISRRFNTKACIMLSATSQFCRDELFQYGIDRSILRSMRENLQNNAPRVLDQFYRNSGFGQEHRIVNQELPYSLEVLTAGLHFLEQVSLLPLEPLLAKSLFLHGDRDRIISCKSGRQFCSALEGIFIQFDGGHNFFMEHRETVLQTIQSFLEGLSANV